MASSTAYWSYFEMRLPWGKGKGHGPILILSVSLGDRKVRQIQVPGEMKKEVEDSLRAFAQTQELLKQIAGINLELLRERKRRRQ